jgi:choline dehydrogenase-like flavoprotein
MLDAIVVGAGPSGNQMALKLAQSGHEVALIDYRARPGDKLCTGIVGRQCFEKYSVPDSTVLHEARSATFHAKDTDPVLVQRERTQAYVIDRMAFISRIGEHAAAAGAHYITSSVVNSIEIRADGVSVTIRANRSGSQPRVLRSVDSVDDIRGEQRSPKPIGTLAATRIRTMCPKRLPAHTLLSAGRSSRILSALVRASTNARHPKSAGPSVRASTTPVPSAAI